MALVDPFAVKDYPRWHPYRLAHKSLAMAREWEARRNYRRYALPEIAWEDSPAVLPEVDWDSTSVTPTQMGYLLQAVAATESLAGTVIVEVGCFRGVTTHCLAGATDRTVVAVNPYAGYGGAAADREAFRRRIGGLDNVIHEEKTSGDAASAWAHGPASLVFIDAIHDYVNTSFDIGVWAPKLARGGILALHDVDQADYAGTRRAAFESLDRFRTGGPSRQPRPVRRPVRGTRGAGEEPRPAARSSGRRKDGEQSEYRQSSGVRQRGRNEGRQGGNDRCRESLVSVHHFPART